MTQEISFQRIVNKIIIMTLICLIFNNLYNFGGIYIDLNSICINPIKNILKHNFAKTKDNTIIYSEKKSYMSYKYYNLYYNNINFDEDYEIKEINDKKLSFSIINNICYDKNLFKEIDDYMFSDYFYIIKNLYFIIYKNIDINNNIFKNINTYNLLIRNFLSYNLINLPINLSDISNYNLLNNIDYIYWINLSISINRKNNMLNLLKNFDIKNIRIEAVDGNIENEINKKYFICNDDEYPDYKNKEYAILLSHLNTLDIYLNNTKDIKYGVSLIFEDDVSLDFIKYWKNDIMTIIDNAPTDWEIIMLGYFSLNLNYNELYNKWNNEWSAIAYLINYKAKDKLNNLKKDNKWICNKYDLMVSDNYIFSKFNTYVYKYPYFTFIKNNDSTFHNDHLDYHDIYKKNNYIILEKIIDEYKVD
jgi:hypothetical protein